MKSVKILVLVVTISLNLTAHADCPPPSSAVVPQVQVRVSYDKKPRLYKYEYTIRNDANAQISLDWFGILMNQAPSSSLSPSEWIARFRSLSSFPFDFSWTTIMPKKSEANKVTSDGTVPEPAYAIKPGGILGGFELTSSQPPGASEFFVEGFTQAPTSEPTEKDDEPTPNCAGWDFENAQLATQVTGVTTGPLDLNTISIRLRAREEKGRGPHPGINPKQPSGKLAVLVLSTRTFDASQVDVSSIMFGPAYAAPVSSQLVQGGIGEQIGQDEREEWERWRDQFDQNDADRKKSHPQNLLLTFDVSLLDVQCHLDQALFLRGKTKSGESIVGAVPAKVIGCKPGELGKHKQHKIPHRWWPEKKRAQQELHDGIRHVQGEGH